MQPSQRFPVYHYHCTSYVFIVETTGSCPLSYSVYVTDYVCVYVVEALPVFRPPPITETKSCRINYIVSCMLLKRRQMQLKTPADAVQIIIQLRVNALISDYRVCAATYFREKITVNTTIIQRRNLPTIFCQYPTC